MKLLVNIPALNEDKFIGFLIKQIPRKIKGISKVDVLVVDDGSKDKTAKVSKDAGATIISHKYNRGVGAAFKTAVSYAIENHYDLLVNIDGDGQFNPGDIHRLVAPIVDKNADFVTATRFKGKYKHEQFVKGLGNKMFTWLISWIVGKRFTDTQCGFRAYSRDALLRLNLMGDFTYTQEVFVDLASKNLKIMEIPIKVHPRKYGKSRVVKSVTIYAFRAIKIVMRSFRDYRPLTFFGLPGLIIFGIGFLVLLGSFLYYLITLTVSPLRTELFFGAGMLVFGFLIITLAVTADMLDRHRRLQEEILFQLRKK